MNVRPLPLGRSISASNLRLLTFGNLSPVSPSMADAFCRAAIGGRFCARALHDGAPGPEEGAEAAADETADTLKRGG
jgi:hypothetical protein